MREKLLLFFLIHKDKFAFLPSVLALIFIVGVVGVMKMQPRVLIETEAHLDESQAEGQGVRVARPRLKDGVSLSDFNVTAQGVEALDLESGEVVFTKNGDVPMLPASTTKIATAVAALKNYSLDDVLKVPAIKVSGKTMGLKTGEEMTVGNLLKALLIFSANDAAEVLAQDFPSGRDGFIKEMNKLPSELGLANTHFSNPTGFDEYLHFSTASDLVILSVWALKNDFFAEVVSTVNAEVASVDGRMVHKLTNINKLLGSVPGVLGVKTGWTENSGESLVTLVERDGHRVIIAMLGSEDRFGESEKLIEWIYSNYYWE